MIKCSRGRIREHCARITDRYEMIDESSYRIKGYFDKLKYQREMLRNGGRKAGYFRSIIKDRSFLLRKGSCILQMNHDFQFFTISMAANSFSSVNPSKESVLIQLFFRVGVKSCKELSSSIIRKFRIGSWLRKASTSTKRF
ncbi:MAG: hypothetical protein K0S33_145 [Bacteroidetes bacterium]|nr:hypothetical protein [Bacteroidota bacterium]